MIIVAGKVQIKAGMLQEALKVTRPMEEATQAEPGCISYRFYVDPYDDTQIMVFEEWESPEALVHHFQTPHMAAFNAELPRFLAGQPDIKRYEIEAITSLFS